MVHCKAWEPVSLLLWDFLVLCLPVVSLSLDLARPVSRLGGLNRLAVHLSKLAVDVKLWWLLKLKRPVVLSVQAGVWLRASAVLELRKQARLLVHCEVSEPTWAAPRTTEAQALDLWRTCFAWRPSPTAQVVFFQPLMVLAGVA